MRDFFCAVAAILHAEVLFETGGSRKLEVISCFCVLKATSWEIFLSCGVRSLLFLRKNWLDKNIKKVL